jgi:hypothetical protein
MKQFLQKNRVNILLLIGSFCISIFAIEIGMRLFYTPEPVLELGNIIPWYEKLNYTPRKNQYGFREEEVSDTIFQKKFIRILILGDSFTFGVGVEKGEDRFTDIIESRLNSEKKNSNLIYHIYNAGVLGTKPEDWSGYLDQAMLMYKPHYVFAVFILRDGTDLCTSFRFLIPVINAIKAKYTDNLLYKYTYIGRYIGDVLIRHDFTVYYIGQLRNAYLGSKVQKKTWAKQQHFLFRMQQVCKKNGVQFHLILFPMLYNLESNYPFYEVEDEITRFANSIDMPVFSLTPGFIGQSSHTLWVSPNDQHPNEKAHRIAADTLYPYIKQVIGY